MSKGILRVFPRRTSYTPTDPLAFGGYPPMIGRPVVDEVHVSVTFTWDLEVARKIQAAWADHYPVVKIGGPAVGHQSGFNFVPGRYVKPGVTFTTRGCNRRCPWCFVPAREGRLIEVPDFPPGNIIQDNNLLQATHEHIDRVFAMLAEQPRAAVFAGGIDPRLVDPWFAEKIRDARVNSVFLAADTEHMLTPLERALDLLAFLGRRKLRVYTLIGFGDDTIEKATTRLERVWELGGMPFAQLYQPMDRYIKYPRDWKALAKVWSRPAAMKALHAPRHDDLEPALFGPS